MHWIERHILKQLAYSNSLRYKDLIPDGVDGNLFQYHARVLEKRGLIDRNSGGYTLTALGKVFVADLSQTKQMNPRKLPRPMVMIVSRNEEGEYLLFKWRRQPYRGLISLPFGRQMYDESLGQNAASQVFYKAGLGAKLVFVGQVDLMIRTNATVVDHLAISLFEASEVQVVTQPDGLTGEAYWGHLQAVEQSQRMAGLQEIITWYEDPSRSALLQLVVDAGAAKELG
jgi:ADP-ribose pyrophosphatase YjhB (NUDIX family)